MRELDTLDLQIYDRPDLLITDLTQTQYLPLLVLASSSSKYAYAYSSNMHIMHTAHKTYSRVHDVVFH